VAYQSPPTFQVGSAARRFGQQTESPDNAETIGRMTPVPTVAMDCGPLESRLDRLGNSERKARRYLGAGIRRRGAECHGPRVGVFAGGSDPMVRLSERI
jgi:hypothetical protein